MINESSYKSFFWNERVFEYNSSELPSLVGLLFELTICIWFVRIALQVGMGCLSNLVVYVVWNIFVRNVDGKWRGQEVGIDRLACVVCCDGVCLNI